MDSCSFTDQLTCNGGHGPMWEPVFCAGFQAPRGVPATLSKSKRYSNVSALKGILKSGLLKQNRLDGAGV